MKTYRVAVIPGDNIGPEVVAEGLRVLQRVAEPDSALRAGDLSLGGGALPGHGARGARSLVETRCPFHAIYLGPTATRPAGPDRLQQLMHPLRKGLDLYVNLRPVRTLPGVPTPPRATRSTWWWCGRTRRSTPGWGAGCTGDAGRVAMQTTVVTRRGAQRVMRYAFEPRRSATASGTQRDQVQRPGQRDGAVGRGLRPGGRGVPGRAHHPQPRRFVQHVPHQPPGGLRRAGGDQSDGGHPQRRGGAWAVWWSIGPRPSANLNPEGGVPGMFEPVHGSAPDIAGKRDRQPPAPRSWPGPCCWTSASRRAARLVEDAVRAALAGGGGRTLRTWGAAPHGGGHGGRPGGAGLLDCCPWKRGMICSETRRQLSRSTPPGADDEVGDPGLDVLPQALLDGLRGAGDEEARLDALRLPLQDGRRGLADPDGDAGGRGRSGSGRARIRGRSRPGGPSCAGAWPRPRRRARCPRGGPPRAGELSLLPPMRIGGRGRCTGWGLRNRS